MLQQKIPHTAVKKGNPCVTTGIRQSQINKYFFKREFYFTGKIYRSLKLCIIHFDLLSHISENPRYSGGDIIRAMHS